MFRIDPESVLPVGHPVHPAHPVCPGPLARKALLGDVRTSNADHAVPFRRCHEGMHDGVGAASIPQDELRLNPGIGADDCILWPPPAEAIHVPELRDVVPSDVLQLTDPLAILLMNQPNRRPKSVSSATRRWRSRKRGSRNMLNQVGRTA